MKTWGLFFISVGAFLILISPTAGDMQYITMAFAAILIVLGIVVFKRSKE